MWKSLDGGTTFKPGVRQAAGAVDRRDRDRPDQPEDGLGRHRRELDAQLVSIGDGIYKSTDGGETWTQHGPARVRAHPRDRRPPDRRQTRSTPACRASCGATATERGVYKTTDGGKTWTLVLKGAQPFDRLLDRSRMDPKNPNRLFAGMWDFRRKGWTFRSGGEGPTRRAAAACSCRTTAAQTWTELDASTAKGLPAKPWGRVAVAVAPSNPNLVYAFIECAAQRALSLRRRRQDVGGARPQPDHGLAAVLLRQPVVDPKNEDRVFKPDGRLIVSNDGGKSFSGVGGGAHGDFHDVWIDPENTEHLIGGDDGGLWFSYDGGEPLVEGRQPAGLAVLPRERGRHGPVPGLRRPAGQQLVGRRLVVPGRHHQQPLGEPVRRRRLLDVRRSDGSRLRLRRVAGRLHRRASTARRTRRATSSRRPATGEKLRFNWNTPIHLSARTRRARSTSARSSCSARATTARPGSASRRTSPPTIRRSRSRSSRAASRSTTRPPRCTRRSTRSASRRRTRRRSGSAPTTATCS